MVASSCAAGRGSTSGGGGSWVCASGDGSEMLSAAADETEGARGRRELRRHSFHPLHAVLNQAANCELEGILVGRGSGGSPQGVSAGGRRW